MFRFYRDSSDFRGFFLSRCLLPLPPPSGVFTLPIRSPQRERTGSLVLTKPYSPATPPPGIFNPSWFLGVCELLGWVRLKAALRPRPAGSRPAPGVGGAGPPPPRIPPSLPAPEGSRPPTQGPAPAGRGGGGGDRGACPASASPGAQAPLPAPPVGGRGRSHDPPQLLPQKQKRGASESPSHRPARQRQRGRHRHRHPRLRRRLQRRAPAGRLPGLQLPAPSTSGTYQFDEI
ncbi:unnamed protein product [Lepidochelys kempii]